ncbi:transposase, partial [Pauljensenia sp. UMB3104]|uniref:transposase n=1 Tax=Pauljensenia sp. UMB3104 TaxID=3046331 RepID=UPI00254A5C55
MGTTPPITTNNPQNTRSTKPDQATFTADEAHISVEVAYHCAQQVRDVFHQDTPAQGRCLAARLVERLPTCPIPEIARLGRTLRKWKDAF